METAKVVRNSFQKGEWLVWTDIKNAYFYVPIHLNSQKYLHFQARQCFSIQGATIWDGHYSSRVHHDSEGIETLHQYLDDWLLQSDSQAQGLYDSKKLVELVQNQS